MGCLWTAFRKTTVGLCALCKLGLSLAIIIIVAIHLDNEGVIVELINFEGTIPLPWAPSCLIATEDYIQEVCHYAYAVAGISMAVSLVLSIFLCVTCNGCGGGAWIEFIVGALLTAWWTCAGIVFSAAARWSNDRGWPRENWRNSIPIMCWVAVLLAGIQTIVYAVDALRCLAKCCCDDDRKHKGRGTDDGQQQGGYPGAQQPGAPPAQQMGKDVAVRANAV